MNSHVEVVVSNLTHVRLSESPESLSLVGKERWEYFNFSFDSNSNSNAYVSIGCFWSFYSHEDWVGHVEVVLLVKSQVITVDFWCLRNNVSSWYFFKIFEKHRVDSIIGRNSFDNLFFAKTKFRGMIIPNFSFERLFKGWSITFVDFFAFRSLVKIYSILSHHVGIISIDQAVCEDQFSIT